MPKEDGKVKWYLRPIRTKGDVRAERAWNHHISNENIRSKGSEGGIGN